MMDSIAAIARGQISTAANKVESTMVQTLPVVFAWLAKMIGIGGIGAKIKAMVERMRAGVNKVVDTVVGKIMDAGRAAFGKLTGKGGSEQLAADEFEGVLDAEGVITTDQIKEKILQIKLKHKMDVAAFDVRGNSATVRFAQKGSKKSAVVALDRPGVVDVSTSEKSASDSNPAQLKVIPSIGGETNKGFNYSDKNPAQLSGYTPGRDVVQLISRVVNKSQYYRWRKNSISRSVKVGKVMEAYLDPNYPLQGEGSRVNQHQDPLMTDIRDATGLSGNEVVKGHLLNDNVGGKALDANLFPLTRAANKVHEKTAENYVKNKLWDDRQGVYYRVTARRASSDIANHNGYFHYLVRDWNPATNVKSGGTYSGTVFSNMGDHNNKIAANPTGNADN